MNTSKLEELLHCILPNNIVLRLFVVQGCDLPNKFDLHPDRKEFFRELFTKNAMHNFLRNHIVVFIDINPLNMQHSFIIHLFVCIRYIRIIEDGLALEL